MDWKLIMRLFTYKDYKTLHEWWKAYDWQSVPYNCLPKTGYIIDGYCAGFLYKTDSNIAWLEWIISNKNANKEEKAKALDSLISKLIDDAKKEGFKLIFTSVSNKSLVDRYKQHGFNVTDENMVNLIKEL